MRLSSRPPRWLTVLVTVAGGAIASGAIPVLQAQAPAAAARARRELSGKSVV